MVMPKGRQKYEIRCNGRTLLITSTGGLSSVTVRERQLVMPYRGRKRELLQYLDMLEKSNRFEQVVLHGAEPKKIYLDLRSLCTWVPASGGLIQNAQGEILLIFRNGIWDLPKGKRETGETAKAAALRECQEETGLQLTMVPEKIDATWHIYRDKQTGRCLKKTNWYRMSYIGDGKCTVQEDEGIQKAEWANPADALLKDPMYPNIRSLISRYGSPANEF